MFRHTEVEYFPAAMGQYHKGEQDFEVTVGTVEKSTDTSWPTWLFGKVIQLR